MARWVGLCALACALWGQAPKERPASVAGKVLNDADGQPLRRSHVVLRPAEAGLTSVGAEADDKGIFLIRDIAPGHYSLLAQRDGYLANANALHDSVRMPVVFEVSSGAEITNVVFRLRPWAVLTGKVRFDDGEPAVSIHVVAYRERREKGRSGYEVAGSAFTNDRGEYRLFGLASGAYLISAVYERSGPGQTGGDQHPVDAEGHELPVMGYATTFFPNSAKLSSAVPVRIEYGQELGALDVSLLRVRKVNVRGRITSGISGDVLSPATIVLEQRDGQNGATLPTPATASFDKTGQFEIKDVTPGSYILQAQGYDQDELLMGRTLLTVSEQDVNGLELMVSPSRQCLGRVRVEGGGRLDPRRAVMAVLEPRSELGAVVSNQILMTSFRDGMALGFQCELARDETYDVYVQNLPDDFYVSAVRVSGADAMTYGLEGSAPSRDQPFEIVLDSRGGKVAGYVTGEDGSAWSGANIMLIPDPLRGRLQAFRTGLADEYGRFQIRGVPPGKYILTAWLDDPPCDVYDPEGLNACRASGMQVALTQASQENVMLTVKQPSKR